MAVELMMLRVVSFRAFSASNSTLSNYAKPGFGCSIWGCRQQGCCRQAPRDGLTAFPGTGIRTQGSLNYVQCDKVELINRDWFLARLFGFIPSV